MTMHTTTLFGTELVNGLIEAVNAVIPSPIAWEEPIHITGPVIQPEMGVLIGITGDLRGRFVLEAQVSVFSSVAACMYGLALKGDMLESFVGELGNMICGNLCTQMSFRGMKLEITPPTVLVGQTKLGGFHNAFCITFSMPRAGMLRIITIPEENHL